MMDSRQSIRRSQGIKIYAQSSLASMRTEPCTPSARKHQPQIRKVSDYIVYYDEIVAMDEFGTVVIA